MLTVVKDGASKFNILLPVTTDCAHIPKCRFNAYLFPKNTTKFVGTEDTSLFYFWNVNSFPWRNVITNSLHVRNLTFASSKVKRGCIPQTVQVCWLHHILLNHQFRANLIHVGFIVSSSAKLFQKFYCLVLYVNFVSSIWILEFLSFYFYFKDRVAKSNSNETG